MNNTLWYGAVIYRWGEDMVGMCIELSGNVQIFYMQCSCIKSSCYSCYKLVRIEFSQDSSITDISYIECMFQDIQIFLSVVFCLTDAKLLPPPL